MDRFLDRHEEREPDSAMDAGDPASSVAKPSLGARQRSWARLLALIGATIAGAFAGGSIGGAVDALRFESAFRADAERRVSDVASRIAAKLWIEYAFRGFFLGSEEVTESEFLEFAQWLRVADSEIKTCAFVRTLSSDGENAPSRFRVEMRSPQDADLGEAFVLAMSEHPEWVAALSVAERNDRICILSLDAARRGPSESSESELALILPLRMVSRARGTGETRGFLVSTFDARALVRYVDEHSDGAAGAARLFLLNPDRAPGERVVVDLAAASRTRPVEYSRAELEELASVVESSDVEAMGAARELAPELTRLRVICLDPRPSRVARLGRYATVGALSGASFVGLLAALLRRRAKAAEKLRIRLEGIVERRTSDLAAANADLEAFAHTVSHDLRAPLRAIEGFASELRDSLGPTADAAQTRYLDTLVRNAVRAGEIVAGLLALSRWTRLPIEFRDLDPNALVKDSIDELAPTLESRNVEFVIGKLPAIRGDPRLVRQVFANLISNAVKYTRERDPARIEVQAIERDDRIEFEIRDNGIGFDEHLAARLFRPFQRLPNASRFDGSGIGLALAARIVTRHGGRISAEGHLDRGSTFRFTLPAASS